jgi:membrane protease YdiL (CAAX protease family)
MSDNSIAPVADELHTEPRLFGAQRASFIFLGYLGVQLAAGFFAGVVAAIGYAASHDGSVSLSPAAMQSATMAGAVAGMVGSGVFVIWMTSKLVGDVQGRHPFAPFGWSRSTLRAALVAALVGVVIAAVYIAAVQIFPPSKNARPGLLGRSILGGGWKLYVWVFLALVVAPPVEEFLFRGVMWTGLARSWGPWIAAVVVTVAFVTVHLTEAWGYAPAIVAIATMAVAALAMRVHYRSLVPPILLHTGYNLVIAGAVLGSHG